MWLFTTDGFYSVVTAEEFGEELQVRARSEADLQRLRDTWLPSLGPTVALPGRDYQFRAFTTRAAFADALVKITLAIDYSNFKNSVAARMGHERASVYAKVWSACLKIENEPVTEAPRPAEVEITGPAGEVLDRTDEYRKRDLHAEGVWPKQPKRRYGGVVFSGRGEVLLREPAGHFDGYVWTFPKGAPNRGEHPVEAALREVLEETGRVPTVIGHVPGVFGGTSTGWSNYFYLMQDPDGQPGQFALAGNRETSSICYADLNTAHGLIDRTTNAGGQERDRAILAAATTAYSALLSESDNHSSGVGAHTTRRDPFSGPLAGITGRLQKLRDMNTEIRFSDGQVDARVDGLLFEVGMLVDLLEELTWRVGDLLPGDPV